MARWRRHCGPHLQPHLPTMGHGDRDPLCLPPQLHVRRRKEQLLQRLDPTTQLPGRRGWLLVFRHDGSGKHGHESFRHHGRIRHLSKLQNNWASQVRNGPSGLIQMWKRMICVFSCIMSHLSAALGERRQLCGTRLQASILLFLHSR